MPTTTPGPAAAPATGTSRRQQYSDATQRALVEVAEDLFTEHGYAATSLDAIVAGAQVTKGALYHHFSGKQALFEAVFARVEADASATIRRSLEDHADPWERATAGLRAYLDAVRRPAYRRIVLQEGPAVLGYERSLEHEERSTFVHVREIVGSLLATGATEVDPDLVATFSRVFGGGLSSAGESVSASDDPAAASERVEIAIGVILSGLRTRLASATS